MSAGPSRPPAPASTEEVVSGEDYVPYIHASNTDVPEFTTQVLVLGLIQAVFFGLADGYLGLKIGLTVSASIPAAVISMAILRGILKRGSVLENNLVQNMASVGESLAAGAVFTLPALYLLQDWLIKNNHEVLFTPSWFKSFAIACLGGMMGILFMIPLRRYLIVKEHGKLRYPEGTACAEVLMAGDKSKGARPWFLESAETERVMNVAMAVATEVAVLRERLDTLERLLEAKGLIDRSAVEAYEPDEAAAEERQLWHARYAARILRIFQQELDAIAKPGDNTPMHRIADEINEM